MKDTSQQLRGILLTGLGVLILTPDSLLIRLVGVETPVLLFWRGLFQFAAIALFLCVQYRGCLRAPMRSMGRAGWLVALGYAAGNILFISSIRLTSVANTLLMVSLSPLLGAAFTRWFLKESVPRRTWVAALVGVVGVAVILSGGFALKGTHTLGIVLALLVAVLSGATFVLIRAVREVNLFPAVGLSGLFIALAVLPWAGIPVIRGMDVVYLLLLGAVIMPVSFGLITQGPRYIPAPEVSLLMLLEAVLGPLWVWLVLGEAPVLLTWVGGGLLLGAVAVHSALGLREALRSPAGAASRSSG